MIDFSAIRRRQWIIVSGIGACLLGGGVIYILASSGGSASHKKPEHKSSLTTGASQTNPQEAWIYQFGADAELTKKRLDGLEEMLSKLIKLNETPKLVEVPTVETLKEDLKFQQKELSTTEVLPPPPGSLEAAPVVPAGLFRSKAVRKISLSLKNARSGRVLKTVDNTIPAGTFAQAILLGGVDASASIQASNDPRPALLRITNYGKLPRQFRSDLKGCHVLAACYGDISSERVMMRLEKLTCTERKTGEIIEVKVQGYVAGEDGRTGVRGTVVDRAGESMRNAMIGGFVSGIGDFISQSRSAVMFSPIAGLAQTNPLGTGDMIRHAGGKGAGNALEKYADFYIKRAEQVQPVIQVAAGRQVDIVFTDGVSISDSVYRQATSRANDQERYQQIQSLNENTTGGIE